MLLKPIPQKLDKAFILLQFEMLVSTSKAVTLSHRKQGGLIIIERSESQSHQTLQSLHILF